MFFSPNIFNNPFIVYSCKFFEIKCSNHSFCKRMSNTAPRHQIIKFHIFRPYFCKRRINQSITIRFIKFNFGSFIFNGWFSLITVIEQYDIFIKMCYKVIYYKYFLCICNRIAATESKCFICFIFSRYNLVFRISVIRYKSFKFIV